MTRLYLLKRKNGKLVRVFTRKPVKYLGSWVQENSEEIETMYKVEDHARLELWKLKNNKYVYERTY